MGDNLRRTGAANDSPPRCGEGLGVGVGEYGAAVPCGTTPHPTPPPQGERESLAAWPSLNLAPTGWEWTTSERQVTDEHS
jgi:hypothetical protein